MPSLQPSCPKCEALNTCCTECLLSGACVILKESLSPPNDYDLDPGNCHSDTWGSQNQSRPNIQQPSCPGKSCFKSSYTPSASYQTRQPPPNNYNNYPMYNPYRSGTWDSHSNRGGYPGHQDCGCKLVRVYRETPGETAPMTTVRVCPNNGNGQTRGRKDDDCEYVIIRGNTNNKGCQYETDDEPSCCKGVDLVTKYKMCSSSKNKSGPCGCQQKSTNQQSSCPKRVVIVQQCDSETDDDAAAPLPLIVFQGPDLPAYNDDSAPTRQISKQPTPTESVIRQKQKTLVCRTTEDGDYVCEYEDRPEANHDDPDSSMCMIYRTTSSGEVKAVSCALKKHTEEEDETTDIPHSRSASLRKPSKKNE